MAGLEHEPVDNATLLRRIVQLEHERDELRRNAEQLSTTQTSIFGGLDLVSRIQGRRASGLEYDIEICEKKLNSCQKENRKLQEELSEVYTIKSKFAELLKIEVEKSAGLEKEVKFFQSRVAAALSDRDRLILKIERFQRKEDGMMEKITDLQDRLDQITSGYTEEKSRCASFQKYLEKSEEEIDLYRKVVETFWRVRDQAGGPCDAEQIQDRAAILLQDSEGLWSFGEINKDLHDQAKQATDHLAMVQEEFQACCASLETLHAQIEKENYARMEVEDALSHCRQQLSCLAELVNTELQQLSSAKASLKEDVAFFLLEEKNWILSLLEAWQHLTNKEGTQNLEYGFNNNIDQAKQEIVQLDLEETSQADTQSSCSKATSEHEVTAAINGVLDKDDQSLGLDKNEEALVASHKEVEPIEDGGAKELVRGTLVGEWSLMNLDDEAVRRDVVVGNHMLFADDSKEALAQALQEKVAALLLLSQEEERHILQSNTTSALESQISSLKQQLSQVTSEKMNALMELSWVHEECLKLQEQEKTLKQALLHKRTFPSSHLRAGDHGVSLDDAKNLVPFTSESARKASLQGYLKYLWPRGRDLGVRTMSLSHMLSLSRSKENDTVGIARLRVENASLQENLSSIRHLCKSANRLRLKIASVTVQSKAQTESTVQAAVEAVDGVISEALLLKAALHSSLPANDLGWNSIGSPLAGASEMSGQEGSDGETNDDLDIVSFIGLEMVRLVLLAAQLQKRSLGQNM